MKIDHYQNAIKLNKNILLFQNCILLIINEAGCTLNIEYAFSAIETYVHLLFN